MQTDISLPAQMRAILRAALPQRAFIRRDRGDAFLASNAPAFETELKQIPGFLLQQQDSILHISPDESWIAILERRNPEPPDRFCETLLRFKGRAPDRENMLLFIHGLKLLDAASAASEAEIEAYERSLRQRSALALRGECGGALYAAAIILNQINTKYKGEERT